MKVNYLETSKQLTKYLWKRKIFILKNFVVYVKGYIIPKQNNNKNKSYRISKRLQMEYNI